MIFSKIIYTFIYILKYFPWEIKLRSINIYILISKLYLVKIFEGKPKRYYFFRIWIWEYHLTDINTKYK